MIIPMKNAYTSFCLIYAFCIVLVEARGIEPLSEESHPKLSTGVGCVLISPKHAPAARLMPG